MSLTKTIVVNRVTNFNFFDAIIIVCGIVLAYNAIKMKTTGELNSSIVLSKNVRPDQIKDKEGFINYLWTKLLACGVLSALAGIINMILSMFAGEYHFLIYVDLAINTLFFVILIAYGMIVVKAQKKFINTSFPTFKK